MGLFACGLVAEVSKGRVHKIKTASTGLGLLYAGLNFPGKFLWCTELGRSDSTKSEEATRHFH